MLARFGVVVGVVCAMVCLIGCSGDPVPSDAAVDAAAGPVDVSGLVPESCGDGVWRPELIEVDRATGCPTSIAVSHPFSGPIACDTVRACCSFAPSCEFDTRLTLYLRGRCGGLDHLYPRTDIIRGCRCVDGGVVCPHSAGISSPCLECAPDGGQ